MADYSYSVTNHLIHPPFVAPKVDKDELYLNLVKNTSKRQNNNIVVWG